MKKRLVALFLCMVTIAAVLSGCKKTESASGENDDTNESSGAVVESAEGLEIIGYSNTGEASIDVTNDIGAADLTLYLEDEALAKALYSYCDKILLNAGYDEGNKLVDYTIIDKATGEDYGKLDAEALYKRFDWQAIYEPVNVEYTGEIHLSELEDGKVYICTMNGEGEVELFNDTNENIVVYGMNRDNGQVESRCFFKENIGETWPVTSFMALDEVYMVHAVAFEDSAVTDYLDESKIISLDSYEQGDTVETGFAECIYNNTYDDVTLTFNDGTVYTIAAGRIAGLDWMSFEEFTIG